MEQMDTARDMFDTQLELLHGDLLPDEGFFLSRQLEYDKNTFTNLAFSSVGEAINHIRDNHNSYNFWASLSRFPVGANRTKAEACGLAAVALDLDFGGEVKNEGRFPRSWEEAWRILSPKFILPTYLVYSGHGVQPVWVFQEPIRDMQLAAKLFANIVATARGLFIQAGYTPPDSIGELARVMRLGGTFNFKLSKAENRQLPPILARFERVGDKVTPRAVAGCVDPEAIALVDNRKREKQKAKAIGTLGLDLHDDMEPPLAKIEALAARNRAFRRLWNFEAPLNDDLSAYDIAIASEMVRAGGFTPQEIAAALHHFRREHQEYTDNPDKILVHPTYAEDTIRLAMVRVEEEKNQRGKQKQKGSAKQEEKAPLNISLLPFMDSDSGNAERLIARHGIDLRYCVELECWLIWDGTKWAKDTTYEIFRRALDTIRAFGEEAMEELSVAKEELTQAEEEDAGEEELKELKAMVKKAEKRVSFSVASESNAKQKAMIELARTLRGVPISVDELDRHHYLLNLKNGTYDLKKGEFRPHRREDMITQVAGVEYLPDALAPRWRQFISEIMKGDQDKADFLQKYAGYAASGDTSESKFPISHGSGANGKSVFNSVLLHVMGDYGMQASSGLVMMKKQDPGSPNPELVQTRGKRLIIISETSDGKYLDEEFVKAATGNDIIRTRDLYGKPFGFRPVAKFNLATNHKPMIKGTDDGIWRRLILVPFEEKFEGDRRDPYLEEKLIAEAPGILNWIIEGFKRWINEGLSPSDSMVAATQEYREVMDSIGNFIKEMCVIAPEAQVKIKPLYEAYVNWCHEVGETPMNSRMFRKRLEERGIKQKRTSRERLWVGIGLAEHYFPVTKVDDDDSSFVTPLSNVIDMPKPSSFKVF